MNEILLLTMTMMSGLILGIIFFGGLWWTVNKGLESKHSAIWFLLSFLTRSSIVVLGFYYLLKNGWQALLAAVVGFLIARILVTQIIKQLTKETVHAP